MKNDSSKKEGDSGEIHRAERGSNKRGECEECRERGNRSLSAYRHSLTEDTWIYSFEVGRKGQNFLAQRKFSAREYPILVSWTVIHEQPPPYLPPTFACKWRKKRKSFAKPKKFLSKNALKFFFAKGFEFFWTQKCFSQLKKFLCTKNRSHLLELVLVHVCLNQLCNLIPLTVRGPSWSTIQSHQR